MDQRQTKLKISQNVHGCEPLRYAHSKALPQIYPSRSGARLLEFKALIGVMVSTSDFNWTLPHGRMQFCHMVTYDPVLVSGSITLSKNSLDPNFSRGL